MKQRIEGALTLFFDVLVGTLTFETLYTGFMQLRRKQPTELTPPGRLNWTSGRPAGVASRGLSLRQVPGQQIPARRITSLPLGTPQQYRTGWTYSYWHGDARPAVGQSCWTTLQQVLKTHSHLRPD